jgi:hypothetical protein
VSSESAFGLLALDEPDAHGAWSPTSGVVFLLVAVAYTAATWVLAGLPPLLGLALRGLGPLRYDRTRKSGFAGGNPANEYR